MMTQPHPQVTALGTSSILLHLPPKRPTVNPTIPKDILKKMGPAADHLNIPNATLTGLLAAVINNSGEI